MQHNAICGAEKPNYQVLVLLLLSDWSWCHYYINSTNDTLPDTSLPSEPTYDGILPPPFDSNDEIVDTTCFYSPIPPPVANNATAIDDNTSFRIFLMVLSLQIPPYSIYCFTTNDLSHFTCYLPAYLQICQLIDLLSLLLVMA
jgi:hypothetical protein